MAKCNLPIFFFCVCAFGVTSKKPLPNSRSWKFTPAFSFKHFVVEALPFGSLSYFGSTLRTRCEERVPFLLPHVNVPLRRHRLLKGRCFPHWMVLAPVLEISWPQMSWLLFPGLAVLFHWSVLMTIPHWLDCCSFVVNLIVLLLPVIYSDITFFMPDIGNLCLLSLFYI